MIADQTWDGFKKIFAPVDFNLAIRERFEQIWTPKSFKKQDWITEAGAIERYFYFVTEGVQIIYLIDSRGEKLVIGFSYPGFFTGVYDSFLLQQPSHYFLETLTPSKVLGINFNQYQQLFEDFPEFEKWGRIFHQNFLIGRVKREVELLTLTAEQRYRKFMDRCPPELRVIPQKYLASYLNMTPETFSRLRKKR